MVGGLNQLLPKGIRSIQWLISEESRQSGLKTSYVRPQGFLDCGHRAKRTEERWRNVVFFSFYGGADLCRTNIMLWCTLPNCLKYTVTLPSQHPLWVISWCTEPDNDSIVFNAWALPRSLSRILSGQKREIEQMDCGENQSWYVTRDTTPAPEWMWRFFLQPLAS